MKKLGLTGLFTLLLATMVWAQETNVQSQQVEQATREVAQKYNLDTEQRAEVRRLQVNKFDNLLELEAIKTTKPQLYAKKRHGVLKQTQLAIRNVLNAEQRALFDAERAREKQQMEALLQEKRAAGASKVEIQNLLLELEDYQ